jgi:hypothetical protein
MITIDESRVVHIFRDALGRFPDDTELSRQALIDVANDPTNILGADHFGNAWAAKTLPDGTQIWVQIRDGRITNGGINQMPRHFNLSTPSSVSTGLGSAK